LTESSDDQQQGEEWCSIMHNTEFVRVTNTTSPVLKLPGQRRGRRTAKQHLCDTHTYDTEHS